MACCPYLRVSSLVGMVLGFALLAALALPPTLDSAPAARAEEKPAAARGDWPLFRGNPLQTGVADAALPETLKVRWKFKTGESIETAPAIVGGVVYVGSLDQYLYAIDLRTGQEKWK